MKAAQQIYGLLLVLVKIILLGHSLSTNPRILPNQ